MLAIFTKVFDKKSPASSRILVLLSALCLVYFAVLPFTADLMSNDDLTFARREISWQIMQWRYMTWSSRIIIDYLTLVFCHNHLLFSIVDCAMLVSTPWLIHRVFQVYCKTEFAEKLSLLTCFAVFFMFPIRSLFSAGYIATSANYFFPGYLMLLGFVLTTCLHDSRPLLTKILYAVAAIGAVIACNQELCAILVILLCLMALPVTSKRKTAVMFLVIAALSLVNTMLCPGSAARLSLEIATKQPDFPQWNFVYKGYMGIMATLEHCFLRPNSICIYAAMVLLYCLRRKIFIAIVGGIALFIVQKAALLLTMNDHRYRFFFGTNFNLDAWSVFGLLLAAVLAAGFVYLWIKLDISRRGKAVLGCIVICAFANRVAMGFSPTLFASSERTFVFFDFIMIMVITMAAVLSNRLPQKAFSSILLIAVLVQLALQARQMLMQLTGQ